MTADDRKLIFEYCGWTFNETSHKGFKYDGIDMVDAMNKMVGKVDWSNFVYWVMEKIRKPLNMGLTEPASFVCEFMQPNRFFKLMAQWLRGKE
jgi:hypothetical protein